jgi:hypothetical protein
MRNMLPLLGMGLWLLAGCQANRSDGPQGRTRPPANPPVEEAERASPADSEATVDEPDGEAVWRSGLGPNDEAFWRSKVRSDPVKTKEAAIAAAKAFVTMQNVGYSKPLVVSEPHLVTGEDAADTEWQVYFKKAGEAGLTQRPSSVCIGVKKADGTCRRVPLR